MNIKKLIGGIVLATTMTVGVGVGLGANFNSDGALKPAFAAGASGTISIDITGEGWGDNAGDEYGNGQNISVYFWDNDSHSGWGSYVYAAYQQYVVFVDYNLTFTPTGMKAVRYSNWYSENDWKTDPWCSVEGHAWGKWNETDDLGFVANGNIIIASTSFTGYAYIEGKSAETSWSWQTIADLSNVKLNGSNHVEYYATLSVTQWEEFGAKIFSSFYGWDACTLSGHITDSDWLKNGDNIQYKGTSTISVNVYFDRNAGSVYIDNTYYAAANDWAQTFLGTNCDYTKSNWSSLATSYGSLHASTKAIFTGTASGGDESGEYYEQAVARYDYIERIYGKTSYTEFMGRESAGKLTPKAANFSIIKTGNSNNLTALIIIGIALTTAVAGYFFLRKKREN